VAGGAHAIHGAVSVRPHVFEISGRDHFIAVALGRLFQLRVERERRLAVIDSFAVDQAQRRSAHASDVFFVGNEVRIGTGADVGGCAGAVDGRAAVGRVTGSLAWAPARRS